VHAPIVNLCRPLLCCAFDNPTDRPGIRPATTRVKACMRPVGRHVVGRQASVRASPPWTSSHASTYATACVGILHAYVPRDQHGNIDRDRLDSALASSHQHVRKSGACGRVANLCAPRKEVTRLVSSLVTTDWPFLLLTNYYIYDLIIEKKSKHTHPL
jgi:hypothetical protein